MLQIRLLGQFDIRMEGKRVTIPSRAGQSLLAYLALTAGTPHRREKLAGTFWPDTTDENARKNLRQELWRIRKAISTQQSTEGDYLLADEFTLKFNREAKYWLDVIQMERPDLDLQSLIANLSLYQGELLPGFYDEWIALERERVQAVFEARMEQLLEQLITAERWIAVQEWGERWLTLSGVREPAYRALMLASGVRGDMAKVASLYQRCMDELQEYLGVEPSAETRALYDGLLKGAKVPPRTSVAQPSGTITFLFTDIEGSTRLLDKMGDQYAVALAEHHEIMRASIQTWNGREMYTQGDAFFVTFTRALDAVQCAAEVQRALTSHSWPQGESLRVRMGLHTGEPLIASTGYVGMDVHRAARIGDAGHGGQILLSHTTRELVMQDLPQGMTIRDLGEHRLKDMKYPTSIYQLVVDGMTADFAPIRTKFSGAEMPTPGEAPFKGLQFFEEGDSDLFFGRETLTAKLVRRLHDANFLSVIIGASGSGKSSLVRAGLVPAIKMGDALVNGTKPPEGSANWLVHIITPTAHPLEALAIELTRDSESVTAAATLVDDLSKDPRSLHFFLSRQAQTRDSSTLHHTLLVIDQFEELFTLCRDEFEREAFIDNLLTALTPTPLPLGEKRMGENNITLIITLRADFYAHLAQYPELRDAVAQQQEYIGPMTTEELRRAIEEPAKRGHWEFEPGLVDLILRDVGDEPGALPLLSHALLETWKRRAGHVLTLKGYADAGGVRGAIAHTAESVYQNLSLDEQTIVRNLLVRLTEFGEGTEDTRRRASFGELMSSAEDANEVRAVLNKLAEARLVTLSEDSAEVAHEALIREWPQLREWLSQDREGIILHRHLTEAAQEWELLERDADILYRGARLAQANEWSALNRNALNAQERRFLDAANTQAKQEQEEREAQRQRELEAARKLAEAQSQRAEEQARAAGQLRKRAFYLTGAFILALILALVALFLGAQSSQNAVKAKRNAGESQNVALIAGSQAALANGNTDQAIALALQAVTLDPLSNRAQVAMGEAAYAPGTIRRFISPGSSIDSVELSPDGRTALTATSGWDGPASVLLWDLQTGKMIRQFEGYGSGTSVAVYSPNGHIVLSEDDRTLILWNIETGSIIRRFEGSTGKIYALAFSPDGRTAISGGTDKTLLLWDIQTGQIVRRFGADGNGHTDEINCVAFSPDGSMVLSGSTDKTMILWDVSTGQVIRRLGAKREGHANPVLSVAFSPDGSQALSGAEESVMILWDVATGNVIRRFYGHRGWVQDVAFSPDGRRALSGGGDATMILWDIATGQPISHFQGHEKFVQSVAFSRDGRNALSGSADGTLRLWDLEGGQVIRRFAGHTSWAFGVARSPDGQTAITSSTDGTAILWDLRTGQEIRRFTSPRPVVDVAYSPDGQTALIATGMFMNEPSDVVLWDVKTGQVIRRFVGHPAGALFVAFSPDGRMAVSSGARGVIILWDVATGKEIRRFQGYESDSPGPPAAAHGLAFSPDGRTLLTGFGDGKIILWDVATGKEIRHFVGHTNIVGQVVFSPDGQRAFSGAWDNTAIYWDVATGSILHRFTDHSAAVFRVRITPDGHFGLGGSADNTTILWDLKTADVLRRYTGSNAGVFNAAFSPDGRNVLVSFFDGSVALWRMDATLDELLSWTKANRYIPELTCEQRALYQLEPLCPEITATPTSK